MEFAESISSEEMEALPLATFKGEIVVVDEIGELYEEAVTYLRQFSLVGFDTESKPTFKSGERSNGISLLQLSSEGRAYLFKTLDIGLPPSLKRILSDPKIVKVGAAVRDDVRGLQRISKFRAASFVDLQEMVEEWGIEEKSLRKMSAIVLGERLSKGQQLSNWEASPLSEAQQHYAALDAAICERIYLKLRESRVGLKKATKIKRNEIKRPTRGSISRKERKYREMIPKAEALVNGEEDFVANLANIAALIKEQFDFFWVGFYLVKGEGEVEERELVLGPFQGPPACSRIGYGKGVCGTAWKEGKTIVVPDVEQFPGHIACSALSRSEIVVPLWNDKEVIAVLDIDSTKLNCFDKIDSHYLEKLFPFLKI